MNSLALMNINEIIEGYVIKGNKDIIIKNITTSFKFLEDSTLIFNLYGRTDLKIYEYQNFKECVVVEDNDNNFKNYGENFTVIKVPNIKKAYWKFVEFYRNQFILPVVGVTGTCGKTSTKEMIKYILSKSLKVHSTYLSKNAIFRNLHYLLGIEPSTEAGVFEMGVAYPGDLLNSCMHFKPNIGIITNIGIDHLQGCKTLENYIKAKSEILEGMNYNGVLLLNADNENIKKIDLRPFKGIILYIGKNPACHYRISDINYDNNGMSYKLTCNNRCFNFFIPGYGEHNVYNAAFAIAASHQLGIGIQEAGTSLKSFNQLDRHMQIRKGLNGSTLIDDTWSSNPTSIEAAFKTLKSISQNRKTIAVIGESILLGDNKLKLHGDIGEKVIASGIDTLITIGDVAKHAGLRAMEMGMSLNNVYLCNDYNAAYKILHEILDDKSIVLIKTDMYRHHPELINKLLENN